MAPPSGDVQDSNRPVTTQDVSISDIQYGMESFYAIVKPGASTMPFRQRSWNDSSLLLGSVFDHDPGGTLSRLHIHGGVC